MPAAADVRSALALAPVVLASASASRRALLQAAGVAFDVVVAPVDEEEAKLSLEAEGADGAAIAESLAALKARAVARRMPGRLVIGADQVLDCDGRLYDKPPHRAAARAQLLELRGRMHTLLSAVAVFEGEREVWHHLDRARLWMRDFSADFLDAYLDEAGDDVLGSVGAYRLEGPGAQLFGRIEGDWFTILGLPLLPLLDYLRVRGALRT
jgi:septum formation protein